MAVTDRATTHALAQEFAAMLQDEPTVRRLWYWAAPNRFYPDELYFQFYMLRNQEDLDSDGRIVQVLTDFQERHDRQVSASMISLTDARLQGHDPLEAIRPGAVELPLQRR